LERTDADGKRPQLAQVGYLSRSLSGMPKKGNLLGGATGFLKSLKAGILQPQDGPDSIFLGTGGLSSWMMQNSTEIAHILNLQALQATSAIACKASAIRTLRPFTEATSRQPILGRSHPNDPEPLPDGKLTGISKLVWRPDL
jgi:hypothetical protein